MDHNRGFEKKDREDIFETELLLSLQMIKDDLEDDYEIAYFQNGNSEQNLFGAAVYYGQSKLNRRLLYVASEDMLAQFPIKDPSVCRICVKTAGRHKDFAANIPVIMLSEEKGWERVFNRVQEIFFRYSTFSHQLYHILNSGGGLYELCTAALEFFDNPLYVHDENFNVLAMPMWVVGMTEFQVEEGTGNLTVPLQKIRNFQRNTTYLHTLSTHGAQIWNPVQNSHRVMYVNLWTSEGKYCGRFLINELNSSLKPSDFTMAEYFAGILSSAIERIVHRKNHVISFEDILRRLYQGVSVDPAYLKERVHMVGWEMDHRLICFHVKMEVSDQSIISGRKIGHSMSSILKNSFSFSEEEEVFTVCNLTLSGYSEKEYKEKLKAFGESVEVDIGASREFAGIERLPDYYRQAAISLESGKRRELGKYYYGFSDCALDYILNHFSAEMPFEMVCADEVRILMRHDAEKGTEYLRTLQVYLDHQMQQTAAAQALYIHRSTLIYRLERILELTGADLEDVTNRLYIQVSIRLLNTKRSE